MSQPALERILEAVLQAAGKPLSLERMRELFDEQLAPSAQELRSALTRLQEEYADRAVELREVAGGWRLQVRSDYAEWVGRLWEERPQRYSRALLETLALIAYRQPVTRGEIEEVRGVAVSSQIIRTLLDREWVRVVGHREVPGRPAMYATTRQFLDYFNLTSLAELPPLAELREPSEVLEHPPLADEQAPEGMQPAWPPADSGEEEVETGTDFHTLLEELNAMETGLKTDFADLRPPGKDVEPEDPDEQ